MVSVIIPVYQCVDYLEEAIASVQNQNIDDSEIICVDDGSTDGSAELCDEYKKRDERITVYHKENGGLSDARNYGMERSHGDFFAFIDSDDALHPDFFTELINNQKQYDADIVACDITLFEKRDVLTGLYRINHNTTAKVFSGEEALNEYFSPSKKRKIHHGLCMKLYKKALFDNLRFLKGKLHEDLYITYRLLDCANTVVYINCPYYYYYQNNSGSICKNYGTKNFLDEAEAYSQMLHYFQKDNRANEKLIHFLIIQYLLMFEKGYDIRKRGEIQTTKEDIVKWVDDSVDQCRYFGVLKRFLIHVAIRDIRIYTLLKRVRHR